MLAHLLTHAFFKTSFGRFVGLMILLLFVMILPVGSVAGFSVYTWKHFAKESEYRRRFGDDWKTQYETAEGKLSTARSKVVLAMAATLANSFVGIWLYKQLIRALRDAEYTTRPRSRGR